MEFRYAAIEELFQFQHLTLVIEVRSVSLQSGMAFPSGSCSQWNHRGFSSLLLVPLAVDAQQKPCWSGWEGASGEKSDSC